MTGSAWHQARGSCRGTSLLPRPFRRSLGSMNRLLRLTGMISFRRSPLPRLGASRSIPGFTVPRALQATLLEDHYLLTLPIPASSCRHDQVPQVDRRVQVPVMPGAACVASPGSFPLQFRVDGAAGAAGPAAGEPHGARITRVWRHWPLASSSRAGSPYPRHLARVLDFPVSAHPRQERGGARLSQNRVTAPGDDLGYVDLEGDHQVGDQDSFPPRRVAGPVSPSLSGMAEPARHGASAPCLGAAWVLYMNRESKIDDRVPIPVMLDTALAARRPRFRLQHWIVEVEGLASPAIRGRQQRGGTRTSRRGPL